MREIIRGLRERGSTVFLNTHLLEEAQHVCDRVAVIDKGRAVATGSLDELLGHHSRVRLKVGGLVRTGGAPWADSASGAERPTGPWSTASTRHASPTSSANWSRAAGRLRP